MIAMNPRKRIAGFALIDIAIASIVLIIAIVAIAQLQVSFIRSGDFAKARSVATQIAQEKLDDLRSFVQLESGGTGTFGYAEIGTNAGGTENADGTLRMPNGAVTKSFTLPDGTDGTFNYTYTLSWTIDVNGDGTADEYYFCGSSTSPQLGNCTAPLNKPYPDFKKVMVTVAWTDRDGAQEIQMEGTINASDPAANVKTLVTIPGHDKPRVEFVPGAAPDIVAIPIEVGDGLTKESTKPEPEVIAQSGTTTTYFDEIIYDKADDNRTIRRDEFQTVNCVCVQGRGDSQVGRSPVVFNPTNQHYEGGEEVSGKRVGMAATGNEKIYNPDTGLLETLNLSKQPEVCDRCCRDHHDITNVIQVDPFRSHDDYDATTNLGGDHSHFFLDASGNLVQANGNGKLYLEACRLVRVDGLWWVAQDWRLESLQTLPSTELEASSQGLANYTSYVTSFVDEYFKALYDGAMSTYPAVTPSLNYLNTNSATVQTSLAALNNAEDTGDKHSVANDNGDGTLSNRTLAARAIYMDYMSDELRQIIKCKMDSSEVRPTGCENVPYDGGYRSFIPFHEVNVTKLANWTWTGTTFSISDEPISSEYSRGVVTTSAAGCQYATSQIERSNTGLTDTNRIDNDNLVLPPGHELTNGGEDTSFEQDSLTVQVADGTCPPTAPGQFWLKGTLAVTNNSNINVSQIVISSSIGACQTTLVSGDIEYQCPISDTDTVTITLSNYTYKDADGACLQNNVATLSNSSLASGVTVNNNGTTSESTVFDVPASAADITSDITIKKDGSGSCL